MILETSFIIDFLRSEPDAASKIKELRDNNIPIKITTPSIFELWSGIISLEHSEKRTKNVAMFVQGQIILQLDAASAEEAGKIDGKLIKIGKEIEPEDCMIAGIAVAKNEAVLTRDQHFDRIEGLKIEKY